MSSSRVIELETIAQNIRSGIVATLGVLGEEHRGHPGPSLSIVDIVTALYYEILRVDPAHPQCPERDRFVLSKGHGCLAVYVALARCGYFSPQHLPTFRSIDSMLQGHPDMRRTPGIDMTSGSLGNGLSAGIGIALGSRSLRHHSQVYVLVGDGELQEGIVWEAAMAASKYGLHNLTAIIDCNGFQSGGCGGDHAN
jgi:transketolase